MPLNTEWWREKIYRKFAMIFISTRSRARCRYLQLIGLLSINEFTVTHWFRSPQYPFSKFPSKLRHCTAIIQTLKYWNRLLDHACRPLTRKVSASLTNSRHTLCSSGEAASNFPAMYSTRPHMYTTNTFALVFSVVFLNLSHVVLHSFSHSLMKAKEWLNSLAVCLW